MPSGPNPICSQSLRQKVEALIGGECRIRTRVGLHPNGFQDFSVKWTWVENGSLFGKAKSGWNAFIFQEKFASTPCAARKIELTATRAKKRFNQEKKERFRREKARFGEIGEKKERNSSLDFSPKISPLTRESMIHFLLLLAKKAEVYHMKTNHYYSDLLRQYPAYMTKEQMYQVLRI